MQVVLVYFQWFRHNLLLIELKIAKKIHENHYFGVFMFKVIQGANRKLVYDFIRFFNSNLGPILRRFWDMATYWLKITNFSHRPLT